MAANHQASTGDVAQAHFKQRRFPPAAEENWHNIGWKHRTQQMMTILAMIGASLFFWAQPAAAASTITEFHVSNVGVPQGIAAGPDGNLWFTEFYDNVAGRITTKGTSTLFTLNAMNSATYITNGPDGALWLTLLNDVGGSTTNQIGRLTTKGTLTTFKVPKASYIWDITTGTDGKLYFTDGASRVWRVTTTGRFSAFSFTDSTGGYPYQITKGPDGNLWFTYQDFTTNMSAIGRITTSGTITLTPTPTANSSPTDITAGSDGNLWFTEAAGNIGRITTS